VHEYGPWPPLHVVFCPEHVQVAGHVVRVVTVVTVVVMVELLYGGIVEDDMEDDGEVGDVGEVGKVGDVGQGR